MSANGDNRTKIIRASIEDLMVRAECDKVICFRGFGRVESQVS